MQFAMLMPAAVAGMILVGRRRGPLLVLGAWIPIATFTAASAFGNTRYRTAAEMSIVILAAVAIDAAIGWWIDRHGASQPDPVPIALHAPGGSS